LKLAYAAACSAMRVPGQGWNRPGRSHSSGNSIELIS
jgi:hypothetical protein